MIPPMASRGGTQHCFNWSAEDPGRVERWEEVRVETGEVDLPAGVPGQDGRGGRTIADPASSGALLGRDPLDELDTHWKTTVLRELRNVIRII